MQLYLNTTTGDLQLSANASNQSLNLQAKLGETLDLEIFPLDPFSGSPTAVFAARQNLNYSASDALTALSWTPPATSDQGYLFSMTVDSTVLRALFTSAGTPTVQLMADITITLTNGKILTTQTFLITVALPISSSSTGTPAANPTGRGINFPDFQSGITGLTGGGATDLHSIATLALAPGYWIAYRDLAKGMQNYFLTSGTATEGPGIVVPADYNASTNAKYWMQA